jgi:hypothetical protein
MPTTNSMPSASPGTSAPAAAALAGSERHTSAVIEPSVAEPLELESPALGNPGLQNYLASTTPSFCNMSDGRRRCEIWLWDGRYNAVLTERQKPVRYIVNDGAWEYLWDNGRNSGIKYKVTQIRGITGELNRSVIMSNRTQIMNVEIGDIAMHSQKTECRQASEDETRFLPSKSVQFKEVVARVVEPK